MSTTNFNVDSLNAFMTRYTTTIRDNNYYGDNIENKYENYKCLQIFFWLINTNGFKRTITIRLAINLRFIRINHRATRLGLR